MACGGCRTLGIVALKNLYLRQRQWFVTLCEVFAPFLFTVTLMFSTTIMDEYKRFQDEDSSPSSSAYSRAINVDDNVNWPCSGQGFLWYSPNKEMHKVLMEETIERLCNSDKGIGLKSFPTEFELVREYSENWGALSSEKFLGAVVFSKGNSNDLVQYKIRLEPDQVPHSLYLFPDNQKSNATYDKFSELQLALDTALLARMTDRTFETVLVKPFRDSAGGGHTRQKRQLSQGFGMKLSLPRTRSMFLCVFTVMWGMIFIVPSITRNVVSEKQSGIQELLRLSGVSLHTQWTGWLLHVTIPLMLSCALTLGAFCIPVTSMMGYGTTTYYCFYYSDTFLCWIIFLLYGLGSAALTCIICALSTNPAIATTTAILIWIGTLLVGTIGGNNYGTIFPYPVELLLSFFPNCALSFIFRNCAWLEEKERGLTWTSAWEIPKDSKLECATGWYILILIAELVVYLFLAIYLDLVIPSEHGVAKPLWLFQCKSKSKSGQSSFPPRNQVAPDEVVSSTEEAKVDMPSSEAEVDAVASIPETPSIKDDIAVDVDGAQLPPSFEPERLDAPVAVHIKNLVKRFGSKVSVNNISLKMYSGEIFALLGHNGAGKTTTISILTGFISPTSGTAIVNGYDIRYELENARNTMGFCPQHNMLFEGLTCMQQLTLFGMIRGQSCSRAKLEARNLLSRMNIAEKSNKEAKKLSGGQKRKLSLGMALIGGTKLVILDEPSSGLDPQARREIWDLLLDLRGERTILLTTHFMEEADCLGDRLAIMADGELQCCGTAAFLKRYYGTGYTLKFTFEPVANDPGTMGKPRPEASVNRPEPDNLLAIIQKSIPDASHKILSRMEIRANTAFFVLPSESATTNALSNMFKDLNAHRNTTGYKYKTISLVLTTMDEVFLRVGTLVDEAKHRSSATVEVDHVFERSPKVRQGKFVVQFLTLFNKKMAFSLQKWGILVFQVVLPALLMAGGFMAVNSMTKPVPGKNEYELFGKDNSGSRATLVGRGMTETGESDIIKFTIADYPLAVTLFSGGPNLRLSSQRIKQSIGSSSVETSNLFNALEEAKASNPGSFNFTHIVAFQVYSSGAGGTKIEAYFNERPVHSKPLAINMAANIFLSDTHRRIEVFNHPMMALQGDDIGPLSENARALFKYKTFRDDAIRDFRDDPKMLFMPLAISAIFTLAGLLATTPVITGPIEERISQVKQLTIMTGVSPLVYWATLFFWDWLVYLVFLVIVIPLLVLQDFLFGVEILTSFGACEALIGALFLYGPIAIIYNYFITLRSQTISGGITVVILVHSIMGIMLSMFYHVVNPLDISMLNTIDRNLILQIILIICDLFGYWTPTYTFAKLIFCIVRTAANNDIHFPVVFPFFAFKVQYRSLGGMSWLSMLTGNGNESLGDGTYMVLLVCIGVLVTTIFLLIELRYWAMICSLLKKGSPLYVQPNITDEDVQKELQRVDWLLGSQLVGMDCLVVKGLTKSFGEFAAVQNLTFGVHHGECFGLLGVNGAGKTTTFRMITGDETPTGGSMFGFGTSIAKKRAKFLSNIGFCPQFDAILPKFTGLQMLFMFSGLRGIPFKLRKRISLMWLTRMGLEESAHVKCGRYSGGMKRRLSTAMAMIGDPALILLDEPTSGVDPISRRNFWKILDGCRASGQSIVLTSHSLDECEALCERLGIMVNGQFQCFGTVDDLKSKFAQGYTLLIKLKPDLEFGNPKVDELIFNMESSIGEQFRPCEITDKHLNLVTFHVKNVEMGWDDIFQRMETVKLEFGHLMEDYSVNESSLEDIFLAFARAQYGERRTAVPCCRKCITCSW